ncbi:hypothetical protein COCNU_08G011420 [Cocos nucifera]|uniref:Uncharacterized protein n=1 Tax=Cocos nucifera TaxID=13894 RepID=A0A8K0N6N8_COCNU|nr:hypothetical protein COCNU_08G011420 [Cocos nucifera]
MAMVGTAVEEGSAARRFWIRSRKEAVFVQYTPFVVCLTAGRLEMEVFHNHISQTCTSSKLMLKRELRRSLEV